MVHDTVDKWPVEQLQTLSPALLCLWLPCRKPTACLLEPAQKLCPILATMGYLLLQKLLLLWTGGQMLCLSHHRKKGKTHLRSPILHIQCYIYIHVYICVYTYMHMYKYTYMYICMDIHSNFGCWTYSDKTRYAFGWHDCTSKSG